MDKDIARIKKLSGIRPNNSDLPTWKAGGLIWYEENGSHYVCLVTPTDPNFGGNLPTVPKGGPEKGDTPQQCAIREVGEETGIHNFKSVTPLLTKKIQGQKTASEMHVFSMEVDGKQPFDPDYEGIPEWYEIIEATGVIKPAHLVFLDALIKDLGISD